jgi:hypothetical protein
MADTRVEGADAHNAERADTRVEDADTRVEGADTRVEDADKCVEGADTRAEGADAYVEGADKHNFERVFMAALTKTVAPYMRVKGGDESLEDMEARLDRMSAAMAKFGPGDVIREAVDETANLLAVYEDELRQISQDCPTVLLQKICAGVSNSVKGVTTFCQEVLLAQVLNGIKGLPVEAEHPPMKCLEAFGFPDLRAAADAVFARTRSIAAVSVSPYALGAAADAIRDLRHVLKNSVTQYFEINEKLKELNKMLEELNRAMGLEALNRAMGLEANQS